MDPQHPIPTKKKSDSNSVYQQIDNLRSAIQILHKILLKTDGRDKLLKLVQYVCKIVLLVNVNANRVKGVVGHVSLARKIVRLGHAIEPLNEGIDLFNQFVAMHRKTGEIHWPFINCVFSIMSDVADDIVCLGKIHVIQNKQLIKRAEKVGTYAWLISTALDLKELNSQEQVLKSDASNGEKNLKKLKMLQISRAKLMCDLVFCLVDVFTIEIESVQVFAGMGSGLLSFYKLYCKEV